MNTYSVNVVNPIVIRRGMLMYRIASIEYTPREKALMRTELKMLKEADMKTKTKKRMNEEEKRK